MVAGLLAFSADQNTLAIAILIPVLGVLSPLLIAAQINRNARATKELDWEREDEVARRAAETAQLLIERQTDLDKKTDEVARRAEEAAKLLLEQQIGLDKKTDEVATLVASQTASTTVVLEKIHTLANGQMTSALRSELRATQDMYDVLVELTDNAKEAGVEPSITLMASLKSRELKIAELSEVLKDREAAEAAAASVGPQEVIIINTDPVPVVDKTPSEPVPVIESPSEE